MGVYIGVNTQKHPKTPQKHLKTPQKYPISLQKRRFSAQKRRFSPQKHPEKNPKTHPKVADFDGSVARQQNVARLDVPVDHVPLGILIEILGVFECFFRCF
jgi:hypothetical protein